VRWQTKGSAGMRVALAEDGALFREGLLMLLQAAGHEVVGCAAGGDELLKILETTSADVAILDIRMPPEPDGGLVTAERLRERYPKMGLLFLSHYAEAHYLMRILDIGTDSVGYRLKEKVGSVEVLSDTLSRIADGEIVIEPVLAKRLVERPRSNRKDEIAALSERELEVLKLMAEGRSNNGIASLLFVTPKAVEKHIASIFGKLNLQMDTAESHRRVLAVLTYLRAQRDD
jgi:DNA-binding NarL/FixJ family response regulator